MKRFGQLCVVASVAALVLVATGGTTNAVVPGGNGRILFTRCVWNGDCTWEIIAADPDGSNEVVLAGPYPRDAWDDHFIANWSPDGQTAIFMAYQAIWQVNADGTHLHEIWQPPTDRSGIDDGPSFTPDGEHIVFTRCCPRVSGYALWMINADGTGLEQITDESVPPGEDGPSDNLPQVSPDGTRIAYHRNVYRNGRNHNRIVTVNMEGTHRLQLTPPSLDAQVPNWSPDSEWVVFTMSPPEGGIEVGIVRADGTDLQQLTHSGKFVSTWPSFSPDGTKIIFSRSMPGGWVGLFTMNPDGSDITLISRHGSADNWPQWAVA